MKQMLELKSIYQQRNYEHYDTLACTRVLNDMFRTNLDDLTLNAHSRMITEDILNTYGLTYEKVAEYESHPWYYHMLYRLYLSLNILRLKIIIAIKKKLLSKHNK